MVPDRAAPCAGVTSAGGDGTGRGWTLTDTSSRALNVAGFVQVSSKIKLRVHRWSAVDWFQL